MARTQEIFRTFFGFFESQAVAMSELHEATLEYSHKIVIGAIYLLIMACITMIDICFKTEYWKLKVVITLAVITVFIVHCILSFFKVYVDIIIHNRIYRDSISKFSEDIAPTNSIQTIFSLLSRSSACTMATHTHLRIVKRLCGIFDLSMMIIYAAYILRALFVLGSIAFKGLH